MHRWPSVVRTTIAGLPIAVRRPEAASYEAIWLVKKYSKRSSSYFVFSMSSSVGAGDAFLAGYVAGGNSVYVRFLDELEASGAHRLRTRSDSEIALHLYEDLGAQCLHVRAQRRHLVQQVDVALVIGCLLLEGGHAPNALPQRVTATVNYATEKARARYGRPSSPPQPVSAASM